MKRRLYLQVYFTFLAVTALCLVAAALAARLLHDPGGMPLRYLGAVARQLFDARSPGEPRGLGRRLDRIAAELDLDLVLWDAGGGVIAGASRGPFPAPRRLRQGWHRGPGGMGLVVPLDGGRFLGVRERGRWAPRHAGFLVVLGVVAAVMAAGSYPLARRMTRRLEALDRGVARFGAGDLGHRVPVEGKDEIAALAERWNQAAARIESLIEQQRQMLAHASHELRSPLARVRMAIELLGEEPDRAARERVVASAHQDIVDLDAMIEELLLAARAQPGMPRRAPEPVDLMALARAEAERIGAEVTGPGAIVPGDAAMLRHMIRNLLANARVHGGGTEVRVSVEARGDGALVAVEDRGPGVPDAERERIFEPFYRLAGQGVGRSGARGETGVGLGLALVRQVARHHGGDAICFAREGGGSRFEVTLPSLREPPTGTFPAG